MAVPEVPFQAIDLFAGAGGLSYGARKAGFQVPVAVEIDDRIVATYSKNHPHSTALTADVNDIVGEDLLAEMPTGRVDLLMGCAPCQGFCQLTAKNRRSDPRNRLIIEMARLVIETRPTAVLMENVPGLAQRGRRYLTAFVKALESIGYETTWGVVQLADYGVPQMRRRFLLLAGHGFSIDLPAPTHAKYPTPGRRPWRTLRDAIYGEPAPARLSATRRHRGPEAENWHVVRDLAPRTRERLRAAAPGRMRTDLTADILPECHQGGYDGFRNVYMRMAWDQPSPTITAGCTTPAKGRFGHPDRRRTTISVREAASLQTFPKSFCIETDKIDLACQMIGNAVPPLFARKVVTHLRNRVLAARSE